MSRHPLMKSAALPRFFFSLEDVLVKNLQDATERICELKGSQMAFHALVPAVIEALSTAARTRLMLSFEAHAEAARTALLHADISDVVLTSFERDIASNRTLLQRSDTNGHAGLPATVDALLLTTTRITTFAGDQFLTGASGFFYRRGDRLFLVSNRHVFDDPGSGHSPDRLEIEVHTNPEDLADHVVVSVPLYRDGLRRWREARDASGAVDIAAIDLSAGILPVDALLQAFDKTHLEGRDEVVAIGDALTIVGFPLGFDDTIHHLAVAQSACIASAYGIRFRRLGCFLTDARTHRGSSGSPVVRRRVNGHSAVPAPSWQLLGVHSTRMENRAIDQARDESPTLNRAWYADVLETLTGDS